MKDFRIFWKTPPNEGSITYQYGLADVIWLDANFVSIIYKSVVHIRTVGIKKKNNFFFCYKIEDSSTGVGLEHLGVRGPRCTLYGLHAELLQALSRNFLVEPYVAVPIIKLSSTKSLKCVPAKNNY